MRHLTLINLLFTVLIVVGCSSSQPADSQPSSTNTTPETEQLSKALRSVDKKYAELVEDEMTEVEVYPASFLTQYQIYRVEHFSPYKPMLFYVGYAPRGQAYLLTGMPENYINLGQADGVMLETPKEAASYATTYLEVTRLMSDLFYQVGSMVEIEFRPNLSQEEEQVKEAFVTQYSSVIKPPQTEVTGDGYRVTVYAVREQALERHDMLVSREGTIQDDVVILEQDLPLVYGL